MLVGWNLPWFKMLFCSYFKLWILLFQWWLVWLDCRKHCEVSQLAYQLPTDLLILVLTFCAFCQEAVWTTWACCDTHHCTSKQISFFFLISSFHFHVLRWLVPCKEHLNLHIYAERDSSVVRAPDLWLKGREFKSLQTRQESFLLQGQLSVSVPPPCYCSSM